MNCSNCEVEMSEMGCTIRNRPLYWCPQCGCINLCDGVVCIPTWSLKPDDHDPTRQRPNRESV